MTIKLDFDRDPIDSNQPEEEPEGMWAIPCPGCGEKTWGSPGCDTCLHSEYGRAGWVLIEAIETQPACKIEDHTYSITFDAGGWIVECLDPHPRDVQEAMMRHEGFHVIPGCLEDGELHDMIAGTLQVKCKIVVDGGSYEYPNDVDVWYEITEVELGG